MARPKPDTAQAPAAIPATSAPYVPNIHTRSEPPPKPPRVEPAGPFLLYHLDGAYTVVAGKVVPRLNKFKLQPGVNGVERDERTGALITGSAVDELRRNGATILDYDVDGPGTSYLLRHSTHPNLHHTKFERFQPGSATISSDDAGYAAWLLKLVEAGNLPAPRADHLQPLYDEKNREVEELEAEGKHPGRLAQIKAQRDAIAAAIAALTEEAA